MREINKNDAVGDVVRRNFKTAELFETYGIDFCCGGNVSIGEACEKLDVDVEMLIQKLNHLSSVSCADSAYLDSLPLNELCQYIIGRHHSYVREQMPNITQKLAKISDVHGDNHPELRLIQQEFHLASINLLQHLSEEEDEIFPLIVQLEKQHEMLQLNIAKLRREHEVEGDRFFRIAKLTNNYQPPADACATFSLTYQLLNDFEQDLHRHVHLENNILFVKAQNLQNK
ncbi:MAG: iron-sulfur cluster repair di-iron protein [Mangrovibacterium sp.]